MKRRSFLALGTAASALMAAGAFPGVASAQDSKKTLKLFYTTNLVSLDPVTSTAETVIQHGYYVFDTLFGVDNNFAPQPQMVDTYAMSEDGLAWTFTLRDGLMFHDGQPVKAEDCAASINRWSQIDGFGRLLGDATDTIEVADDKTFTIKLKWKFPRMIDALAKVHSSPCFIMPLRLASQPTSEPVTEMIGSGPYKFLADEFVSGSKAVYEKFEDYKPRAELGEMTAGGKAAKFDRIEWVINTDPATGLNALNQAEVDILQYVSADLFPLIEGRDDVQAIPYNAQVPIVRFNSTQAPFNNAEFRRIAARALSPKDVLASLVDQNPALYEDCKATYPCGMPGVIENAGDLFDIYQGDFDRSKADLAAAGYNNERVVILNPTTSFIGSTVATIVADQLRKAGFNVDLQDMEWGTLLERRRSRESVDNGGWSIFTSAWTPVSISNPALNPFMRGDGENGYAGWYENAELEGMITEWMQAETQEENVAVFARIQDKLAEEVPTVPLGQFYAIVAARSDITGLEPKPVIYPWLLDRV